MQGLFESVFSKILDLVRQQIEAAEARSGNNVKVWNG